MSALSPTQRMYDLMRGALAARAVGIAADLGIAVLLADGARPVSELAQQTGSNADTLHRVLRALASEDVFNEVSPGVFANTETSEILLAGAWKEFGHFFATVWHRAAGELDLSGEPSFPRIYGADYWTWLAEHPDERAAFDRAMVEGVERRIERLVALDWREGETVVDVGGGNGSLLLELLKRQPEVRGVVLDLPETVRDKAAFGDRIEFVAGNFFERVPAGDTYVLGTILHDWPDEEASAILRTIRSAAPAHARLLVLDSVVPSGNERHGAKWQDLLMLVLFAGRERDETQWRMLLDATGWEPTRIADGLVEAICL